METILHFNYLRKEMGSSKSEDLVSTMDIVPYKCTKGPGIYDGSSAARALTGLVFT